MIVGMDKQDTKMIMFNNFVKWMMIIKIVHMLIVIFWLLFFLAEKLFREMKWWCDTMLFCLLQK